MMNIKKFVSDCILTFLYFIYEGLIILTDIIKGIFTWIKSFYIKSISPAAIDFYYFSLFIASNIYYEILYNGSILFLRLSQIFSFLSNQLLTEAEKNINKKAW